MRLVWYAFLTLVAIAFWLLILNVIWMLFCDATIIEAIGRFL